MEELQQHKLQETYPLKDDSGWSTLDMSPLFSANKITIFSAIFTDIAIWNWEKGQLTRIVFN